jgi:hypothetical protein
MEIMKIRTEGKEHQAGNAHCPACDQKGLFGEAIGPAPYKHQCGGLMHTESFGNPGEYLVFESKCDRCEMIL